MPPLEWVELIAAGYKLADEAGLLDKLAASLKGKRRVLVLGASGAGKTQFINSIRRPLSLPISRTDRTRVSTSHRVLIQRPFSK